MKYTCGGTLYVGVADDGTVTGVEDADAVMLRLNNMVRDSIKPDITMFVWYETLEIDGKEEMRSLEQELTFSATEKIFQEWDVAFDRPGMQTLGLRTVDGIYFNLGLLSDQCPSTVKTATFSGREQTAFQDRREFQGSLFQQMEDVYAYLDLRNQTRATFEDLYRTDSRDYPEVALREALMNCLVHRDYSYRASTLISVYDDRIEFVSIGGLPDGVETDDIMLEFSICRNPKLAAVFYRLELIEAYGTGIPKIMRAYQDRKWKPKIEVTSNAFKITLPNCNAAVEVDTAPNSQEQKVIEYLKNHERIIRKEVDTMLGISQSTSSRLLKRMLAEGTIRQEGAGRRIRYLLKM